MVEVSPGFSLDIQNPHKALFHSAEGRSKGKAETTKYRLCRCFCVVFALPKNLSSPQTHLKTNNPNAHKHLPLKTK